MGYYGCNKAEIRRDTVNGERVIVARVFVEDIGPAGKWIEQTFPGWASLPKAMIWIEEELSQLSM